ncbi:MAG: T9SS type A sorting domain-containing protein [Ignavibacteriaceae bacterium]
MFWLGAIIVSAQIKRVEFAASDSVTHCRIIPLSDNSLLALYTKSLTSSSQSLYIKQSDDNGETWREEHLVDEIKVLPSFDSIPPFTGLKLNSGKVIIIFKDVNYKAVLKSSADMKNWSAKTTVLSPTTSFQDFSNCFSLLQTSDNSILFSFSIRNKGTYICKSTDNGTNWRVTTEMSTGENNPFLLNLNSGRILKAACSSNMSNYIVLTGSSNNGETWDIPYPQITHSNNVFNPTGSYESDGSINIYFESFKFSVSGYRDYNIFKSSSTDQGQTFSAPVPVTHFSGYDRYPYISSYNGKNLMNFKSNREDPDRKYSFRFGALNENTDLLSAPYLYNYESTFPDNDFTNLDIKVITGSYSSLQSVKAIYSVKNVKDSIELFDDGLHSDTLPNDFIYGNKIIRAEIGARYETRISLTDINNTYAIYNAGSIIPLPNAGKDLVFQVNKISMPLDNRGILAQISYLTDPFWKLINASYEGTTILFSAGFALSGYSEDSLWANGSVYAGYLEDYYSGNVGSSKDDLRNRVYTVSSSDVPFGPTWLSWKTAVELGARFYDGDKDGIYNPKDLNNNSQWDPSEDKPDMLGDLTAFCVYNDAVPFNLRLYKCPPQQIEIRQTLFGSGSLPDSAFNNTVFIRYSIVNKNPGVQIMDSVFFSLWSDPDIGDGARDYVGTDTLRQSVYVYKKTVDHHFGINSPSLFSKIVQGPVGYIPGETYNDINHNSKYDTGVDTPLDTAYNRLGKYLGYESFPGAKNIPVYSTTDFMIIDQMDDPPIQKEHIRNYMKGFSRYGATIDPCHSIWSGAIYGGVNCNKINGRMAYSGDPVTNFGWINTLGTNKRSLVSVGPFQLEYNKPIDIITAYIAGRGSDSYNSIDVARGYADVIQNSYEKNFPELYSYKEISDTSLLIIGNYELFQNHPNPFNPYTIIKYTVEAKSQVSVKVFDILGREVATPVDEEKEAGNYQIRFDAGTLSSGVYFYQLHAGDFVSTKKMILVK